MRKSTKMIILLTMVLVFLLMALPAWGQTETPDLELVGKAAGLVLVPEDGKFFDLGNLNPGDIREATLEIRNDYSKWYDLYLKAEDPTAEEPSLFEVLQLTVTYKGERLHEGKSVDGFAKDPIFMGRFQPGEKGKLVATIHLPGPETGNEYQGKTASVKWIFTAQTSSGGGDDESEPEPKPKPKPKPPEEEIEVSPEEPPTGEPVVPPEPPEVEVPVEPVPGGAPPEMPKTGEKAPYPYYLLGALVLLAGVKLAGTRKHR